MKTPALHPVGVFFLQYVWYARGEMPNPNPPTPGPVLGQYLSAVSALAQRAGIASIAVLAIDPQTGAQIMIASPGAAEALRGLAAQKFKLVDPGEYETEVDWPR